MKPCTDACPRDQWHLHTIDGDPITADNWSTPLDIDFSGDSTPLDIDFSGDDGLDTPDVVNHPPHYRWLPVEVIEITEKLNFCLGNVIKYVLRADHKGKPVEDLKKARWYLDREIARREAAGE